MDSMFPHTIHHGSMPQEDNTLLPNYVAREALAREKLDTSKQQLLGIKDTTVAIIPHGRSFRVIQADPHPMLETDTVEDAFAKVRSRADQEYVAIRLRHLLPSQTKSTALFGSLCRAEIGHRFFDVGVEFDNANREFCIATMLKREFVYEHPHLAASTDVIAAHHGQHEVVHDSVSPFWRQLGQSCRAFLSTYSDHRDPNQPMLNRAVWEHHAELLELEHTLSMGDADRWNSPDFTLRLLAISSSSYKLLNHIRFIRALIAAREPFEVNGLSHDIILDMYRESAARQLRQDPQRWDIDTVAREFGALLLPVIQNNGHGHGHNQNSLTTAGDYRRQAIYYPTLPSAS